jgi:hypothetical protein
MRRISIAITLVLLLVGCKAARPRRFIDLTVLPAPPVGLPAGTLNSSADEVAINSSILGRYAQAFLYESRGSSAPIGLFCPAACDPPSLLTVTALAAAAPPPAPEAQSSVYLRSAERAQAAVVRNFLTRVPSSVSAADAFGMLAKALGGIVLKSSQQNKLPTLVRPIVTLQYTRATGRLRILTATYKAGAFAAFGWADQVWRDPALLSVDDRNDLVPSHFRIRATPIVVAVVRRVRNARGANTSVEDDDRVQFVAQTRVLDPLTLGESPKNEYLVRARTPAGAPLEVRVLPPGDPSGTPVVFLTHEDAERFIVALRRRLAAATSAELTNGLAWGPDPADLTGYRITWASVAAALAPDQMDWNLVSPATLHIMTNPLPSAPLAAGQ